MTQGQLSKNFCRPEFECRCGCGKDTVDAELIRVLEKIRELCGGHRVTVLSGCRCEARNKAIGGAKNSYHLLGKAVDFTIKGVDDDFVADCAEDVYKGTYGIIRYDGFTHIDVRDGFYREDRRSS